MPPSYYTAQQCYLCKKPFNEAIINLRKVLDHDHFTGRYIGAAHSFCNLQRRKSFKIPVFFHNFRGYDSHFIAQAFGNFPDHEINPIAQTLEKYLQVEWGKHIVFRDSLGFKTDSLENLTKSLLASEAQPHQGDLFEHFHEQMGLFFADHFYDPNRPQIKLAMELDLKQKGVFPYEYVDSPERLHEQQLPTRAQFYDRLHDEECSEEDYARAVSVWRTFMCRTLEDYLKLYLRADVLLLADVFENFRRISRDAYKLDPVYYISLPQMAWDALLKFGDLQIQLQHDPEIYRMIAPAIRGGICHASVRHARANNKYMGNLYQPNDPSSFIFNFDANNLYGWAQSQPLPVGELRWITKAGLRDMEESLQTQLPDAYRSQDRGRAKEVLHPRGGPRIPRSSYGGPEMKRHDQKGTLKPPEDIF